MLFAFAGVVCRARRWLALLLSLFVLLDVFVSFAGGACLALRGPALLALLVFVWSCRRFFLRFFHAFVKPFFFHALSVLCLPGGWVGGIRNM